MVFRSRTPSKPSAARTVFLRGPDGLPCGAMDAPSRQYCGIKWRLVPHTPLASLQPPASLQVFALAEAISQTRIMLDYVQEFLEIRILIPQHNKPLCELARKGGRLLPHLQAGGAAVVAVASGYRLRPPHPPPTRPMARPSRKLAGRAPAPAQEFWFQSLGFSGVAHRNGRPAATLRGKWKWRGHSCLRFSSFTFPVSGFIGPNPHQLATSNDQLEAGGFRPRFIPFQNPNNVRPGATRPPFKQRG